MDYGRPDRAERLAAAYALGELRGPARRRFEALLPAHPGLREALGEWNDRLMPLTAGVAPEPPSAAVWPRIEARIGGGRAAEAAPPPWWRRIGVWQLASALSGGAALGLALLLTTPGPVQAPIVVVLSSTAAGAGGGAGAGVATASFVASISGDGRALVTQPIQNVALQPDRSFELWSIPAAGGAPRSLGVISASGTTVVRRDRLAAGAAALAVSVEPPGGSPSGAPTGPVVFVGKLTS